MITTAYSVMQKYINDSRQRLDRLEVFHNTPAYLEWRERLTKELNDEKIEFWLGEWLIKNMYVLDESPLDWIEQGRLDDVHQRLLAITHGVYL